jgi:hypothetical protein
MIGGQGAVDAAAQGLSDSFFGAIDQSGLEDFAQNSLDLGAQIDRIKGVDLGAKISDKFKGLTDAFNPDVAGSPAQIIRDFFTGGAETPNSISYYFSHLGDSLSATATSVSSGLKDILGSIFDPNIDGSPMNSVLTLVGQVVGDENLPGEVAAMFGALPDKISEAAATLFDDVKKNVFDPVINFLIGTDAGSITDIINQFIALVGMLPAGVVQALANFGGMIYNAIVVPIINVMNAGIGAVEGGIRNIASFFAGFLGQIIDSFDTTEVAGTNLGGLVPQALRDFQAGLASVGSSFTIGRISTELPSFLAPPGGATGGMFSKGLMKVGERGEELIFNATKTGVIPHDLTAALTSLTQVLAQPSPMPVMAGNYDNSQSSQTNNFYGVQGANDVVKRMAALRGRG